MEDEAPQEIVEAFVKGYKIVRESFGQVNPTQAEKDQARKKLQEATEMAYQAFEKLAMHVIEDGNNVPAIMATSEARNIAQEFFTEAVSGVISQKDPADIIGELGAHLMVQVTGPLNMMFWERFQRERIEAMASDKV